jgi:hypothetical protein
MPSASAKCGPSFTWQQEEADRFGGHSEDGDADLFFDIRDGERDTDDEGVELQDLHAARIQAIKFAGDYVSGDPALLDPTGSLVVNVLDEGREPLLCVTISVSDPGNISASG